MFWQQQYSSWYSSAQQDLVVGEATSKKNTEGVERMPVLWPLSPSLSMFLLQEGAGCAWGEQSSGRHPAESWENMCFTHKILGDLAETWTDQNWEPTDGESICSHRNGSFSYFLHHRWKWRMSKSWKQTQHPHFSGIHWWGSEQLICRDIVSQENHHVQDPSRMIVEVKYYIATESFISVIPTLLEVFATCPQFSSR